MRATGALETLRQNAQSGLPCIPSCQRSIHWGHDSRPKPHASHLKHEEDRMAWYCPGYRYRDFSIVSRDTLYIADGIFLHRCRRGVEILQACLTQPIK
jgi:hypothetical protein